MYCYSNRIAARSTIITCNLKKKSVLTCCKIAIHFFFFLILLLAMLKKKKKKKFFLLGSVYGWQTHSELSQVSGKSEVVINAIADGVISLNSQGIIQPINPAAQRIIGWGKQDALSLDYRSVLKLVDKAGNELTPASRPIAEGLATNKEVVANDFSLVTNSGKKILVSVIVSPVGQLGSGAIVVFRDITKEKGEEQDNKQVVTAHKCIPVAAIEGSVGLTLKPATAHPRREGPQLHREGS